MTIMSNKAQKSKEKTINKQSHYKDNIIKG